MKTYFSCQSLKTTFFYLCRYTRSKKANKSRRIQELQIDRACDNR